MAPEQQLDRQHPQRGLEKMVHQVRQARRDRLEPLEQMGPEQQQEVLEALLLLTGLEDWL